MGNGRHGDDVITTQNEQERGRFFPSFRFFIVNLFEHIGVLMPRRILSETFTPAKKTFGCDCSSICQLVKDTLLRLLLHKGGQQVDDLLRVDRELASQSGDVGKQDTL